MDKQALKNRTKAFAVAVLEVVDHLPKDQKGRVVTYQLVKAATSAGANYRAACRGRSKAEYVSKLQTVLEESDESHYWLEIIVEARLLSEDLALPLLKEADELTAIFNSALHRLRG